MTRLSEGQRLAWLRLIRSERIGPRTFRGLINRFGGAEAALDALPDVAKTSGRPRLHIASRAEAERELAALARIGGRFIAQGEPEYPRALLATDAPPPLIAVRGSAEVLARPAVAIVGSRNLSASGGVLAERLAAELGRAGYAVVSGLARGIDARAHRAAIATGTVAVLAGGHDRIYPPEHESLLAAILDGGGLAMSEMPMGWVPRGRDFPRRNRIVSGLSYGVVVVEAARRSGSLITARFALEQGREVFAVPGSPLDPRAEGTNDLIRNGATLCGAAEHVTSVLEPLLQRPDGVDTRLPLSAADEGGPRPREAELWDELDTADEAPSALMPDAAAPSADRSERDVIIDLLGSAPVSADDLARQAGLPIRTIRSLLAELELEGRIERHGNDAVSLVA